MGKCNFPNEQFKLTESSSNKTFKSIKRNRSDVKALSFSCPVQECFGFFDFPYLRVLSPPLLNGVRLRAETSKRPEEDLVPSQGHMQHCSTINPSLLYYFQIIFKWAKSLWGIKTLLNLPPPSPNTSMAAGLSCPWWRWQRLRPTLRRWSAMATGRCKNWHEGRDNKHELKSLKRTGRQIKGFRLSGRHRS